MDQEMGAIRAAVVVQLMKPGGSGGAVGGAGGGAGAGAVRNYDVLGFLPR